MRDKRKYWFDGEILLARIRDESGKRNWVEVAKIEKCPKCGGNAIFEFPRGTGEKHFSIQCVNVECPGPAAIGENLVEVVTKWNRRAKGVPRDRCDFCGGKMAGRRWETVLGDEEWIMECEHCGVFSSEAKGTLAEAKEIWESEVRLGNGNAHARLKVAKGKAEHPELDLFNKEDK